MAWENYLSLAFFVAFAVFIPLSFLLTSRLLRKRSVSNPVKNAPYESAEASIGSSRDIDNEYLGFFALFLPFELVAILVVLWAIAARDLELTTNIYVMGLPLLAMALAAVGYKLNGDARGR